MAVTKENGFSSNNRQNNHHDMLPTVNNNIVIALDAMGGDFAPLSVIQGASFFLDNLVDPGIKVFFQFLKITKHIRCPSL